MELHVELGEMPSFEHLQWISYVVFEESHLFNSAIMLSLDIK